MNRFRTIFLVGIAGILTGCASARQNKVITVGIVRGDVSFRIVGSYSQENDPFQALSVNGEIPVGSIPVGSIPLSILANRTGTENAVSINIGEIGGKMSVEVIGSGFQNSKSYEIKTSEEHILVGELEAQFP